MVLSCPHLPPATQLHVRCWTQLPQRDGYMVDAKAIGQRGDAQPIASREDDATEEGEASLVL